MQHNNAYIKENRPMDLMSYKSPVPFRQDHLLTLQDYSKEEILSVLSLALRLKKQLKAGETHHILKGQTLAMIFTKSSTRTRVSFQTGIYQLGGQGLFLSSNDIQLGRGEPIEDTAQVLGRMVDGIMIRTFKQSDVETLAKYSGIPVINGLTDEFHPCQVLADLLTYYEHKGSLTGKLAFIGDGNNMAHSLMLGCSKLGMDVAIASPEGYLPNPEYVAWAKKNAEESGSKVIVTTDPKEAVEGADCIYTDVWASMGQEAEKKQREEIFGGIYCVSDELAKGAKSDYIFLHCLPAHRGEEVLSEVIDGSHSVIFDEAENRLHAQKAVMALLMGDKTL
jgi:ornithine carbamoyltransferase